MDTTKIDTFTNLSLRTRTPEKRDFVFFFIVLGALTKMPNQGVNWPHMGAQLVWRASYWRLPHFHRYGARGYILKLLTLVQGSKPKASIQMQVRKAKLSRLCAFREAQT